MGDTIREKIIQDFMARAALIKPSAYVNDLSNALRCTIPVPADQVPCCNVIPGQEEVELKYGKHVCTLPLTVEAFVTTSSTNNNTVQESLLGDLIKAFTRQDAPVSTYVDYVHYTRGGPASVPDDGDATVAVSAVFEVKYSTQVGNPYEQ